MRRAAFLAFVIALAAAAGATATHSTTGSVRCGPYGNLPREGGAIASRDGRTLAWTRSPYADNWARVFVSRPDGSSAVPVPVPPGRPLDFPIALSPSGSEILISRHGDSRYIWASTRGSTSRFISPAEARDLERLWRAPAWSPDGEYWIEAEWNAVYVVSADGTSRRLLAPLELPNGATWSQDGSLIAIGTESGLHVVKPDGTGLRTLPKTAPAESPDWSPDGRLIAFAIDSSLYHGGSKIGVIRPDGSGLRILAGGHQGPDRREATGVEWIDAKTLVFSSYQHLHDGAHKISDIHTIGVDGRNERRVTYQCHLGTTGDDVLRGSILGDTMRTFAGDDDVRPGPGRDDVDAGPGADVVRSRDQARDRVRCGRGRDRVVADRRDVVGRDCERVERR